MLKKFKANKKTNRQNDKQTKRFFRDVYVHVGLVLG